ncbi:hypothetical protein EC957_002973 [Mortierella hygrophila]|uniref:F-box domain-containing protein n=1 Tax=Mortierella hygrophila TaxID=979708 RepID=A0A9P6K179_9FUNG|nr:hypothetical protein EC957_002973 [Mortierella hygrophila]
MSTAHPSIPQEHQLTRDLPGEIISLVGSFLDPKHLFVTIQLSRRWNDFLVPRLWRHLYDSSGNWPQVLKQIPTVTPATTTTTTKATETWVEADGRWLRDLFVKYGHHIRSLDVSCPALIAAISSAGTCTGLQSFKMWSVRSPGGGWYTPIWVSRDSDQQQQPFAPLEAPGPLVSPVFEGHILPNPAARPAKEDELEYWNLVQHVWLLVRQNVGLQRLTLCKDISQLAVVSADFIHDTLSLLPNLEEFEFSPPELDLDRYLSMLPKLRSFSSDRGRIDCRDLLRPYSQLSSLSLRLTRMACPLLFTLLKNLPGLVSLRIGRFDDCGWSIDRVKDFLGDAPINLQGLYFGYYLWRNYRDHEVATLLIPTLTRLTTIVVLKENSETAKAVGLYCRHLRVFRQAIDETSLHPVSGHQMAPNVLCGIIESCPDLEELDAISHKFEAQRLLDCQWASSRLIVFRVQIIGVERLTAEQQDVMDTLVGSGRLRLDNSTDLQQDSLSEDERRAVSQLQRSRLQQHEVLSRMSHQWSSLKTLCFGHEYRNYLLYQLDEPPYYEVDGVEYLRYGDPIPNTLELSLESGLDRLSTLNDLELFGFEGLDHRIGKAELEWMAVSWPRLKIMRGLQESKLPSVEVDKHTKELREYFQTLRPEVVHATKKISQGLGSE